ncbi:unnamed protein product [Rhizophagus irregularis]|nr:unnamed protein product [Rhizophagus irregularis]
MRCLLLSKLIISTVLIIFNQIILSNCTFTDIQAILIEDGIYCLDLTDIKPKPDNLFYDHPIPSGNKIMFLEELASNFYVNTFDTTLKKMEYKPKCQNFTTHEPYY